jgi:hypothetical protein
MKHSCRLIGAPGRIKSRAHAPGNPAGLLPAFTACEIKIPAVAAPEMRNLPAAAQKTGPKSFISK